MRKLLGQEPPCPKQLINDASAPILHKDALHHVAVKLRDADWAVPSGRQPTLTGEHLLQILHRKADDQNVPCAVSFVSRPDYAEELAKAGYTEQAVMLWCMTHSQLAWDASGLTQEVRSMLCNDRMHLQWRLLGSAPSCTTASKPPAGGFQVLWSWPS